MGLDTSCLLLCATQVGSEISYIINVCPFVVVSTHVSYIYIYIHMYMQVCIPLSLSVYIYTYIHICICVCIYIYIHIYVYACVCIYIYIYRERERERERERYYSSAYRASARTGRSSCAGGAWRTSMYSFHVLVNNS